jgi:hypothetical protein
MAGQSRIYQLNILADTKGLTDGLDKAQKEINGAQSNMSKAFDKVKVAVAAATAAGAAFAAKYAVDAVKAASDLSETISKVGVIFGNSAKQVEAFAAEAALTLGQSKQQALDAAATFATFGKSAGLAGDDLVKFSTDFTSLASDLASFNNTSPEEAILAIGSALRGEAEPLRRYGVLLDDASLRQAALELGIVSTTKNALTPQQKVLAAQELIFKQTGDAQGDFARTSDGLANSQRILAAQLDNVKTTIGTALLPIATELFGEFSKRLIPAVEGFADTFQNDLIPYLERRVFPAFSELKDSILGIGDALQSASADAEAANAIIQALETTIIEFVPVTLGALDAVVDAWATFLDIVNRVRAFLSGDLATATREFENRFSDAGKQVNNVNESMVKAYKQFEFFNRQNRDTTIPTIEKTTSVTDSLTSANTRLADSTRRVTEELKQEFTARQSLDLIRSGFGSAIGVSGGGGALPGGESFRSAAQIVSQFGGFVPGFNQLPTDPFFGFGKGSSLQGFQKGGSVVNINVNGTVIDPEGAARAIEQIINESNARGGALFTDLLGINP